MGLVGRLCCDYRVILFSYFSFRHRRPVSFHFIPHQPYRFLGSSEKAVQAHWQRWSPTSFPSPHASLLGTFQPFSPLCSSGLWPLASQAIHKFSKNSHKGSFFLGTNRLQGGSMMVQHTPSISSSLWLCSTYLSPDAGSSSVSTCHPCLLGSQLLVFYPDKESPNVCEP